MKIVLESINFEAQVLTSYIISRCGRKIRCYIEIAFPMCFMWKKCVVSRNINFFNMDANTNLH